MKTERVKVLETSYDKHLNKVFWKIQFLEGEPRSPVTMVFVSDEIGYAVGINSILSDDLIEQLCKEIKGKEINLEIKSDIKDLPNIKDMNPDQMQTVSRTLGKLFDEFDDRHNSIKDNY